MINISYPGSICAAIYNAIQHSPGLALRLWQLTLLAWATGAFAIVAYIMLRGRLPAIWQNGFNFLTKPYVPLLYLVAGVVVLRIPNLILPEQNVDESQYIAAAGTFYNGGIYWKDVGSVHGPLIAMPLALMSIVADGINYTSIRIFGLLCVVLSLLFSWNTLRLLYGQATALLVAVFTALFYALAHHFDMIAYNSEHIPMLLMAVSIYLFFKLKQSGWQSMMALVVLGVVLGLFPFSKLNATFVGLCIGVISIVDILRMSGVSLKMKITRLALLGVSALVPAILAALYIITTDSFAGFMKDNITGPLLYSKVGLLSSHKSGLRKLLLIVPIMWWVAEAQDYLKALILVLSLVLLLGYKSTIFKKLVFNANVLYASLIFAAAFYAVVMPGNGFQHYLVLIVVPFTIFMGVCIGEVTAANNAVLSQKRFAVFYFLILLLTVATGLFRGNKGIAFVREKGNYELNPVSKNIMQYAHANEKMSVWGWEAAYYAETGLVQGNYAGILHPFFFILDSTAKNDNPHLADYIHEMEVNKPVVFLDAVAPEAFYYSDTTKYRHETFPALGNYVARNYQMVDNINGFRIYIRNERLRAMGRLKE